MAGSLFLLFFHSSSVAFAHRVPPTITQKYTGGGSGAGAGGFDWQVAHETSVA